MKLKCIIAGSRSLGTTPDGSQLTLNECPWMEDKFTECEWSDRINEIVSGEAKGVDKLGEQLAERLGLELTKFPANWSLGKAAGHIRNADMAKYADMAIVYWDGHSRGSKNMIENMKKLGKPCVVYIIE
jgi:hypothetical protein